MDSIRENLKALDCPFLEEDDHDWPNDILFAPSEARLKLLTWLVSLFDEKFEEVLEGCSARIGSRVDSKVQRLLFLCSLAGICNSNDVELIQGTCSRKRQMGLWRNLVDLVLVSAQLFGASGKDREDKIMSSSHFQRPDVVSSCHYMDTLVREDIFPSIFSPNVQLFPPDMEKNIFPDGISSKKDRVPLPSIETLETIASKLLQDAEDGIHCLTAQLENESPYSELDKVILDSKCKQLDLGLTMLSQTVETFLHHCDSEIAPWCNRALPELSGAGELSSAMQRKLTEHNSLLSAIHRIRRSENCIVEKTEPFIKQMSQFDEDRSVLQSQVDVLEESLRRLQSGWQS